MTAKLQGGGALSHGVDLGLLSFLLQCEELAANRGNLLELFSTAMRDGEEYLAKARQAAPIRAVELLKAALSCYRHADWVLRLPPRDYQENLHAVSRAVRKLEQELSDQRWN